MCYRNVWSKSLIPLHFIHYDALSIVFPICCYLKWERVIFPWQYQFCYCNDWLLFARLYCLRTFWPTIFLERKYIGQNLYSETLVSESLFKLVKTEISSSNYKSFNFNLFLKYALKQDAMEPSSSSEESMRFIVTYATVAKHPNASHVECTPCHSFVQFIRCTSVTWQVYTVHCRNESAH